jgi:hypothetical protein
LIAALVLAGIAVAAGLALAGGGHGGRPAAAPAGTLTRRNPAPAARRRKLSAALARGVGRGAALGGAVEAAAMLGPWRRPVLAVSDPGGASRWMRMWSMSKIVTMVTLLRELGWGKTAGRALSPEVRRAERAAVTRSENCPQRRVVLELERAAGGSSSKARAAVARTLRMAGAEARVASEIEAPEPSCVEYLEGQHEIADPLAPALLLGTSTWRVGDAVRFIHALGAGVYGPALSHRVLTLMRAPKAASHEALSSEYTPPVNWGAGRALAGLDPAYKAGWGGTQQGEFLAGQIALFDLPHGGWAAVAVMFHPDVQPPEDDPGRTAAPRALELSMGSLAAALEAGRN